MPPGTVLPRPEDLQLLAEQAHGLAEVLTATRCRVVFAESCTAGLVPATLATIPGISDYLCGSQVVYRNRSKQLWLGVSVTDLECPGPVSEVVAEQMVRGALAKTVEAQVAAAVTGHLGPGAPAPLDGQVFIATLAEAGPVETRSLRLPAFDELPQESRRIARQYQAAAEVLAATKACVLAHRESITERISKNS